jgi:hypothetical protein
MKLRKIHTLKELEREKIRLRYEADVARELFKLQVSMTMDSGKKAVLGSWKSALPVVAFVAIKRFFQKNGNMTLWERNPTLVNIQNGLRAFQQPGSQKWLALIPVLRNLWEDWMAPGYEDDEFQADGSPPVVTADRPRSVRGESQTNTTTQARVTY